MNKSSNLNFEYLVGAQAQKHLTVNNALALTDAASQWVVHPTTASLDDGSIALHANGVDLEIWLNGGAQTITPKAGWRAYFVATSSEMIFDGTGWKPYGSNFLSCKEFDLNLGNQESASIEEKSIVFGCTARVLETISGNGLTGWKLGVPDDTARYGSGLWLGKNGWAKGLTGTPITYWNDTDLSIQGEGGAISAGRVLVYVYVLELPVPEAV